MFGINFQNGFLSHALGTDYTSLDLHVSFVITRADE